MMFKNFFLITGLLLNVLGAGSCTNPISSGPSVPAENSPDGAPGDTPGNGAQTAPGSGSGSSPGSGTGAMPGNGSAGVPGSGTGSLPANRPEEILSKTPIIEISDYDFGKVTVGALKVASLIVKNTGSVAIKDLNLSTPLYPFSFVGWRFPGTNGTCSGDLAPGSSCEIAIQAQGVVHSVSTQKVTLTYKSGDRSYDKEVNLRADFESIQSGPTSLLEVSGPDFGTVIITRPKVAHLVLKNADSVGISELKLSTLYGSFSLEGGKFPGTTGTCATTLAATASCKIALKADQTWEGVSSDILTLTYKMADKSYKKTVALRADFRELAKLSAYDVYFGSVDIGISQTEKLSLRNLSVQENIDNVAFQLQPGSQIVINNPSSCKKISAISSCELDIVFTPKAAGDLSEKVTISYETQGIKKTLDIKVTGKGSDTQSLFSQAVNFWSVDVGTSQKKQLRLISFTKEEIQNLAVQLKAGSQFTIPNPSSCQKIPAWGGCDIDVIFAPRAQIVASEKLTISYEIKGIKKTLEVGIEGKGQDLEHISIENATPITQVVNYNAPGQFEIVLKQNSRNSAPVDELKIEPASLIAAGLQINSSFSTCLATTVFRSAVDECSFILESTQNIKADVNINKNINITYRVGGLNKAQTLILNNNFQVKKLELAPFSNHSFGTERIQAGQEVSIRIVVSNPFASSIVNATNLGFADALSAPLEVDRLTSTCITNPTLAQNRTCTLIVKAKPSDTIANFNKTLDIQYTVGGDVLKLPVTLTGNFIVVPKPSGGGKGAPGIQFLRASGTVFGPVANVLPNTSFKVPIEITNISLGNVATATTFSLEPYEANGVTLRGWRGFHIQLLSAESTCFAPNLSLPKDAKCTLMLEIKPDPAFGTNLGVDGRKFRLNYVDTGGYLHEYNFDLKGSWTFAGVSQVVLGTPANVNVALPAFSIIKGEDPSLNKAADPWFLYSKRENKTMPLSLATYPKTIWDKIPAMTFDGGNHVPWTFRVPLPKNPTSLKDIVPDRVKVDGVWYTKLYHGSTSDVSNVFKGGAINISFSAAQNTVLGAGFYLAADPNESKKYACWRQQSKPAGIKPILLIVGVQEDPAIMGKESWNELSTDSGDPLDPNIFFLRNPRSGYQNQFVFFSNVKPFLRILEVMELDPGFGMASGTAEGDGFGEGDPTPDSGVAYKCLYK